MPDTLSLSTGVSLGLLAGIVSGVCYLIANGIARPNDRKYERRLPQSPEEGACRRCGGEGSGGDLPCICPKRRRVKFSKGAWFLRQAYRTLSLMPWSLSADKLEQIDEEREGAETSDEDDGGETTLRGVREFLEKLSARLAGGPLEQTPVHPLYTHPACVALIITLGRQIDWPNCFKSAASKQSVTSTDNPINGFLIQRETAPDRHAPLKYALSAIYDYGPKINGIL